MWKSATQRLRKHGVLAEMVRTAERLGSYTEPWENVPGIWETYDSEAQILQELYQQWRHELAGAVFVAIEHGHGDLCSDVGAAYAESLARLRGVKRIIDAYADHPAIAKAVRKERALLAAAGAALRAA